MDAVGERVRAFWERIREDIRRNPGLWLGVGISAAVLVIAYLAYRRRGNANQAQVPANGYGFPDYSSANGSSGGSLFGGYAPYQPASPALPVTPTASGVVTPASPVQAFTLTPSTAYPSYPAYTLAPAAPSSPLRAAVAQVVGSIQNPLKASQLAHRGMTAAATPTPTVRGSIQNPTAASQLAHVQWNMWMPAVAPTVRGSIKNPTSYQDAQHRGTVSTPPTHYIIPTTIRPQTVTNRGRVA